VSFRRGCNCEGPKRYFFTEVDATVYRSRCDWFWNIQKSLRPVLDGSDKIGCRLPAAVAFFENQLNRARLAGNEHHAAPLGQIDRALALLATKNYLQSALQSKAGEHVVEPERLLRACHPEDSDAYSVDRRRVNSIVRLFDSYCRL
jgi:hypothetical protein